METEDELQVIQDDEQNNCTVIRPGYRPILNHVVAGCGTEEEAIEVAEALDSHGALMRVAELLVAAGLPMHDGVTPPERLDAAIKLAKTLVEDK